MEGFRIMCIHTSPSGLTLPAWFELFPCLYTEDINKGVIKSPLQLLRAAEEGLLSFNLVVLCKGTTKTCRAVKPKKQDYDSVGTVLPRVNLPLGNLTINLHSDV